jgi:hypothetical protein
MARKPASTTPSPHACRLLHGHRPNPLRPALRPRVNWRGGIWSTPYVCLPPSLLRPTPRCRCTLATTTRGSWSRLLATFRRRLRWRLRHRVSTCKMVTPRRTNRSRRRAGSQSAAAVAFATRRRRETRRLEWAVQTQLAGMLGRYLDPALSFWSCLENRPRSMLAGVLQRGRGINSGFPDLFVSFRRKLSPRCRTYVVFIELKSRSGIASRSQKEIRLQMLPTGGRWFLARSAPAALTALYRSGAPFRQPWKPPRLERWEGPFEDPTRRLPTHPLVRIERRAARERWKARKRDREVALAAEQRYETDFPASTLGDCALPGTLCCTPRQQSRPGDQLPSKAKFGP